MSDQIIWRKSDPEILYPDYVSTDDRWRIINRKRSKSKLWEQYDVIEGNWHGDWLSLAAAKDAARRRAVTR